MQPFFLTFSLFLCGVLGVDGLDLVAYQLHFVLEFLDLAVHLVDERVALLGRGVQETEVVLVGLHLALQLFVLAHQTGTLIVEGVLATLGYLLEVVLELAETALGYGDVEVFIELVEDGVVLFVEFVFLLEGYVANGLILFYQFLDALL